MSCPHCLAGIPRNVTHDGEREVFGHWVPDDNGTYELCRADQEPSPSQVLVERVRNRLENALLYLDDFIALRAQVREGLLDLRRALGEIPLDTGEKPE